MLQPYYVIEINVGDVRMKKYKFVWGNKLLSKVIIKRKNIGQPRMK